MKTRLRPSRTLRLLLFAVASLLAALAPASGGQWRFAFSGGTTHIANSSGAEDIPYASAPTPFVDHGYYFGGGFAGNTQDRYGSAASSGAVSVDLTWDPGPRNDPAPDTVIVSEAMYVSAYCYPYSDDGHSLGTGFDGGNAETSIGNEPGSEQASFAIHDYFFKAYKVVDGKLPTITRQPHASILGDEAGTVVIWGLAVAPVSIYLSGGVANSQAGRDLLIGQRLAASVIGHPDYSLYLTISGYPTCQWTLSDSGGDPFKSFDFSSQGYSSTGHRHDLAATDYQQPDFFCSFAKGGGGTLSCVAHFAVPAGALPVGGIDVNLTSALYNVDDQVTVNSYSNEWIVAPQVLDPTLRDGAVFSGTIRYRAQVTTPSAYVQEGDAGGWLWMQTLAYGSTRTLNDGTTVETKQAGPDPQLNYHTQGIDIGFGYRPTRPDSGDPSPAGTFTAAESDAHTLP